MIGALSLKCFTGMGNIHGIPFENTSMTCPPGVLNCVKISASMIMISHIIRRVSFSVSADLDVNEAIFAYDCGLKLARGGCVNGIAQGVTFDTGVHYGDAKTCFCNGDLCNTRHFCDTCSTNGARGLQSLLSLLVTVAVILSL